MRSSGDLPIKGRSRAATRRCPFPAAPSKGFERVIDAARPRSARMPELRATSNLARLLARQHKRDNARDARGNLNCFTEGFDTADLKEARALLDELKKVATSAPGRARNEAAQSGLHSEICVVIS